tara:strand:+ start:1851 stop:2723 length:873 start_codon:yes stop_codon:yes gene_type:complete
LVEFIIKDIKVEILKEANAIYTFRKDINNLIKFCPDRGGIITDWTSNGQKILYFDEKRFHDESKSIRGGIPVLFPICGNLEKKNLFGKDYIDLKQHGFARNSKWDYKINTPNNSITLFLNDNEIIREYYPYAFELKIEYALKVSSLTFNIHIFNKSKSNMPISFGLHPYFNISNFQNIKFIEYSKTCLNQKDNTLQNTHNLLHNLSQGVDLLMHTSGETSFHDIGFNRKITLIQPSPFDTCVIWSSPPRKMLCMEPWTSPRNALVSGIKKIDIPPCSKQKLSASIKIDIL